MSDESVQELRAYLDTKREKNMNEDKVYSRTEMMNAINTAKHDALHEYKQKLAGLIMEYANDHNLCDEGVKAFCEDAGIEINQTWSGDLIISLNIQEYGEDAAHAAFESALSFLVSCTQGLGTVNEGVCEVQNVQRES